MSETPPAPPPLPPAPPLPPLPPEPPRFLGRFALLYGLGLGTLVYAIGLAFAYTGAPAQDGSPTWPIGWIAFEFVITLVVVVCGAIATASAYTRAFGSGLLISLAMGLIVGNGVCIALLSSQ